MYASSTTALDDVHIGCGPANSDLTIDANTNLTAFSCLWSNAVEVRVTAESGGPTASDVVLRGGLIKVEK